MDDIRIIHHSDLSGNNRDTVLETLHIIHDDVYVKPLRQEAYDWFMDRPKLIILIAYDGEKPVSFKVGYESPEDEQTLFSYVGGTHPDYRNRGLATELMKLQHDLAKEMKFSAVETKSRPRWAAMVRLNYKSGFELVEEYIGQKCGTTKYLFRKELVE